MHNVLAPVTHPDPASRLNSATRVESFLRKAPGQMPGAFSQPGALVRLLEMSDRNRTCQPGRVTPHPDIQPGPITRQIVIIV